MRKFKALFLTVVVALVVGVLPMLFAVHVARQSALDDERSRTLAYAQEVLLRSEITGDQVRAAVAALREEGDIAPCSARGIALMRKLALRSTNIQFVGYVSGNRLVCSSLGTEEVTAVDLGPPTVIHANGVRVRSDAVFAFAPASRFVVVEDHHYAAVIHKATPFVATPGGQQATLAVVAVPGRQVLTALGDVNPEWTVPILPGQRTTIVTNGNVIAKAVSGRYQFMAVAAVSTAHLDARVRQVALKLVPIGFGFGVLLAGAVVVIARYRMALPAVIKDGLRRDEFFLVYQPVVNLQTGRWTGVEALIRWRRDRDEVIRPDEFIAVAEASGLITRITERVVQLVRDDAATLLGLYPDFHIGINLAPEDLHDRRTITLLTGLLEAIRAGPGNVVVEATERGFTDPESAAPVIRALRAAGIRVAIDDFGTGYSSLATLQSMEVDYLKIDKAFVDTLGTDAATGTVALHIIEMAKALNLEMIAEGVTTEAQAASLRERGVQYAQGWLFAKPMPIGELLAALHSGAGQGEHFVSA
jgi:sensor c-di-GMP phosphodiesterase-like protein